MDTAGRLLRLREEVAGLLQLRRHLLERLANLDENITFKERLADALEAEAAREGLEPAPSSGARYGGLRAAILERLGEEPDGATGIEIGRMLRLRFGDEFNPKSHHAVLRRLAGEGLVEKEGRRWRRSTTNSGQ